MTTNQNSVAIEAFKVALGSASLQVMQFQSRSEKGGKWIGLVSGKLKQFISS